MPDYSFSDRDLSWLSFNFRVLEEAAREETPLLEKVRFLSIYCSNLDEFYRVRIPALAALQKIKKAKGGHVLPEGGSSLFLLSEIAAEVHSQLEYFGRLFTGSILPALSAQDIRFIYHEPLPEAVKKEARACFFTQLLAFLQPIGLSKAGKGFFPENDKLYFLLVLDKNTAAHDIDAEEEEIVLLNIPSDSLPRFIRVEAGTTQYILFIDDIIRDNLGFIFPGVTVRGAYSFKITRDAELDLEDEYEGDLAEKIEKKLAKRDAGLATRLLYEPGIPLRVLETLIRKLSLDAAYVVEGGRYHNLRDLADFPVKNPALSYTLWPPFQRDHDKAQSLLQEVTKKDMLLHTPYESYDPVLQFFNEASIDPAVEEIWLTMYRVAKDSLIGHALISAARNGKKVTVFVELKARFDEANNLRWARKMKAAGVRIIYSIPALKVHAKIALVKRRIDQRVRYSGLLATGNLNENTARYYTDHILLTGQHDLMRELELLFIFLSRRKDPRGSETIDFHHLLVAQFNLQQRLLSLIDREIANARQGLPASVIIKVNNLEEPVLIRKLYDASEAGVKVQLIVRSICCCIPGVSGMSEHITVQRIVDRYLEHGRVFIFHNNGNEEIFLGSADWMNRNIYRRIEVCFPLYDEALKEEIKNIIRLQLADTGEDLPATHADRGQPSFPSQAAIYQYLAGRRSS
jgi:polyphosphate kinase